MQNISTRGGRVWSRSGCATCKRRRKKCDEGKPSCGPCSRLGLRCDYDSAWRAPCTLADRPRKRPRRSNSQAIGSSCIALVDGNDLREQHLTQDIQTSSLVSGIAIAAATKRHIAELPYEYGIDAHHFWQDGEAQNEVSSDTLGLPSRLLSGLSSTVGIEPEAEASTYYLWYYVSHLSSWLVMVDANSNPLRETIIPRLSPSPMLLHAVCAVSACHLSQQSNALNSHHELMATTSYLKAMAELNKTLSDTRLRGEASWDSSDAAMLTAAFMCKYEIIRGSTREWRYHLAGLTRLVNEVGRSNTLSPGVRRFLRSFITYHCQVARVTSTDDSHHPVELMNPLDMTSDSEELDTYMGFTKGIVALLGRTSRVPYFEDEHSAAVESKCIYDALQSWNIADMAYMIPAGVTHSDVQNLHLTAAAFHSAAFVYLFSILESRFALGSVSDNLSQKILEKMAGRKHEAVARCFNALRLIPEGVPCESAQVLPLFIMGCESEYPTEKMYAIQRLRDLEANVGLGNISRARSIVEYVQSGAASQNGTLMAGPKWNKITDNLGWDVIIT